MRAVMPSKSIYMDDKEEQNQLRAGMPIVSNLTRTKLKKRSHTEFQMETLIQALRQVNVGNIDQAKTLLSFVGITDHQKQTLKIDLRTAIGILDAVHSNREDI